MKRTPYLLKLAVVICVIIVVLVPVSIFTISQPLSVVVPENWGEMEAQEVFVGINDYRKANGLSEFVWDSELESFALYRATDMVDRDYFSHYDPQTGKVKLNELPHPMTIGENLYQISGLAVRLMDDVDGNVLEGWKSSPAHNELMLFPLMHRAGVALARTPTRIIVVLVTSE